MLTALVAYRLLCMHAEDLKPTEATINQIAGNKGLLAGFDDPEIMQAVNDVAQNPANIQKYKNNKKVANTSNSALHLKQLSSVR